MSSTSIQLGLLVHSEREAAAKLAHRLQVLASARGMTVTPITIDANLDGIDLIIGIGGDGTLLSAAAIAMDDGLPVVGVNLGRVGYLADIEQSSLDEMLDGIENQTLEEISRMTIEASTTDGRTWTGINEVVVEKLESRRLVQIAVDIGGHYFTTYRADGIITATSLGSTAYSLSAGGPVLDPALDALVVTPVAPHSLLSRSLVLTPRSVIRYTIDLDRPVRLNVDGKEATILSSGDTVTVRTGPQRVRFLSIGAHPFPQAVRHQFGLDHA